MLRISSSIRNNLVSFDWLRTGAEHTTRPFIDSYLPYLHRHDSVVFTWFTEARDTKTETQQQQQQQQQQSYALPRNTPMGTHFAILLDTRGVKDSVLFFFPFHKERAKM